MKIRILSTFGVLLLLFFSCEKDENTAPVLSGISNQGVTAGQTKNVVISATDADGNSLTFSIQTNPGFLSITDFSQTGNTATATLVIEPGLDSEGSYNATVLVDDGEGGTDSKTFIIEVTEPVNRTPVLASIGNKTVIAGETENVEISATDMDGDSLTFSITTNPGFLSITGFSQTGNTATATLIIQPGVDIEGNFNATIQVNDGKEGSDTESIAIEVVKPAKEGKWLKYWSGAQPGRLTLNVKYYCVRFTKPTDWDSISIDSIKIVVASSGSIRPCFWNNSTYTNSTYWPENSPMEGQSKSLAIGGNKWSISSNNWIANQSEFFVGFEQIGSSITLCSDMQCEPENRSYRQENSIWEQEMGIFANYCIDIYVTKISF